MKRTATAQTEERARKRNANGRNEAEIKIGQFPMKIFNELFGTPSLPRTLRATEYRLVRVIKACSERFVALVHPTTSDKEKFALKFYHDEESINSQGMNELHIMTTLRRRKCEHILQFCNYGILPFGYFFVFPFIERTIPPSSFPDVWQFLEKLVHAVEGCHRCNVVHCDIKPDNFLYSENGDLWLFDFESALMKEYNPDYFPLWYGTPPYWAPEVCAEEMDGIDFPVDMWGLGITIIQMIYNPKFGFNSTPKTDNFVSEERNQAEAVLSSIEEFMNEKQDGDFPWPKLLPPDYQLFSNDHKKLQALLSGLLTMDPNTRMTAKQALDFIVQANK